MTNTVTYPNLEREKLIGIDSTEDPTAFICLLEKRIGFFLGSRAAANENNIQTVYYDRKTALFGSVSQGSAV